MSEQETRRAQALFQVLENKKEYTGKKLWGEGKSLPETTHAVLLCTRCVGWGKMVLYKRQSRPYDTHGFQKDSRVARTH